MSTLRINSCAELLQAIPHLLGFHPSDGDIVIVGFKDSRTEVSCRLDAADAGAVAASTLAAFERAGVQGVLIACYGLDDPDVASPLVRAAYEQDIDVVDIVTVGATSYRSFILNDEHRLPTEASAALTAAVANGSAPFASRRQRLDVARREPKESIAPLVPTDLGGPAEVSAGMVLLAASVAGEPMANLPDDELCAYIIGFLQDPTVHQLVGSADLGHTGERLWRHLARIAPDAYAPPVLLLAATDAYFGGDAMLASAWVDHALALRPDYGPAMRMRDLLVAGVQPKAAAEMLRSQK